MMAGEWDLFVRLADTREMPEGGSGGHIAPSVNGTARSRRRSRGAIAHRHRPGRGEKARPGSPERLRSNWVRRG